MSHLYNKLRYITKKWYSEKIRVLDSGSSGLLDFVLYALRELRLSVPEILPCDVFCDGCARGEEDFCILVVGFAFFMEGMWRALEKLCLLKQKRANCPKSTPRVKTTDTVALQRKEVNVFVFRISFKIELYSTCVRIFLVGGHLAS